MQKQRTRGEAGRTVYNHTLESRYRIRSGHTKPSRMPCRLDPCSSSHAAYVDDYGVLHYLHVDKTSSTVTGLARFQLHLNGASSGACDPEASQHAQHAQRGDPEPSVHGAPRALQKAWRAFDFVPGHPGEVMVLQRDSGRVLYAALPRGEGAASDVFLFGQHTGAVGCG